VTLVDSNILIDILGGDPRWASASIAALADQAKRGPIAINEVIYAELSAGFERQEQLDREIDTIGLRLGRRSFSPAKLSAVIARPAARVTMSLLISSLVRKPASSASLF
jgi:predicted nucleic acid-binding protein